MSKNIQTSFGLEPHNITKDLRTIRKEHSAGGEEYFYDPSIDINQFYPLSQFTQKIYDILSQDERIADVLKYLYTNDESGDDNTSSSLVLDRIELDDLYDEFKSSTCLNINNCISDDAESHTSVINGYLENENDPLTKNELEEFARQRRFD